MRSFHVSAWINERYWDKSTQRSLWAEGSRGAPKVGFAGVCFARLRLPFFSSFAQLEFFLAARARGSAGRGKTAADARGHNVARNGSL